MDSPPPWLDPVVTSGSPAAAGWRRAASVALAASMNSRV
jgi:hypothetical protein